MRAKERCSLFVCFWMPWNLDKPLFFPDFETGAGVTEQKLTEIELDELGLFERCGGLAAELAEKDAAAAEEEADDDGGADQDRDEGEDADDEFCSSGLFADVTLGIVPGDGGVVVNGFAELLRLVGGEAAGGEDDDGAGAADDER
jgi:hypothetical protein